MLEPERVLRYPNLLSDGYKVTSPQTINVEKPRYNCVGWAACGDTEEWWQPGSFTGHFWPIGTLDDGSLDSYIKMFERLNYRACTSDGVEFFWEKIAIYAYPDGEFAHVCYQLFHGWTSKLGEWEDIWHKRADSLAGEYYGNVHIIMKRRCGIRGFLSRACFRFTSKMWPIDRSRL